MAINRRSATLNDALNVIEACSRFQICARANWIKCTAERERKRIWNVLEASPKGQYFDLSFDEDDEDLVDLWQMMEDYSYI